jgi:hypothetical protein
VRHRPTGEIWVVAAVHANELAWAGWPPGVAAKSDCELLERCDDERHTDMVRRCMALEGGDDRKRLSRWHTCDACRVSP